VQVPAPKETVRVVLFYATLMKGIFIPTPWSRTLLEKLTVVQLVKKFSAFYGTQMFITVFTTDRH
jgi:hypothetical protein